MTRRSRSLKCWTRSARAWGSKGIVTVSSVRLRINPNLTRARASLLLPSRRCFAGGCAGRLLVVLLDDVGGDVMGSEEHRGLLGTDVEDQRIAVVLGIFVDYGHHLLPQFLQDPRLLLFLFGVGVLGLPLQDLRLLIEVADELLSLLGAHRVSSLI